jgi:hypothetical protein
LVAQVLAASANEAPPPTKLQGIQHTLKENLKKDPEVTPVESFLYIGEQLPILEARKDLAQSRLQPACAQVGDPKKLIKDFAEGFIPPFDQVRCKRLQESSRIRDVVFAMFKYLFPPWSVAKQIAQRSYQAQNARPL